MGNIHITLDLPPGSGFVYVPLPFGESELTEMIVEPESTYNAVLHGRFRPESNFGVCQISLEESHSIIHLTFRGVFFSTNRATQSENVRSINVLVGRSFDKIRKHFPGANIPYLKEWRLHGLEISRCIPSSEWSSASREHIIKIPQSIFTKTDIIAFIGLSEGEYYLYIVLGIMGLLLGYFATPRLIHSPKKAIYALLASIFGLIVLIVIFFGVLEPSQKWRDTTTIVTIGMVLGLLIGFLVGSIQIILESKQS